MRKQITILGIATLLLAGCTSPRKLTLFSGSGAEVLPTKAPQYVIEPGDMLQISYYATNQEAVSPYNSAGSSFLVQTDGTITAPVIGKVKLADKTVEEAIDMLTQLASTMVKQPLVRLHISNAMVSVLGEVAAPQQLGASQPITLPQALAQVGGPTRKAKLNDIMIYRHEGGIIRTYHVNLLSGDIFTSPCYYLQKGDVMYVAPQHAKKY